MPWFKIDDGFHGHPKVVELSLDAVGLWTLCGSWCAKYLTDGFVPDKTVTRLGGTHEQAAELVTVGLWDGASQGYQFCDWADYQPLKIDIEAERAAAQERMRGVRAKKKGVQANETRTTPERSGEQTAKFGRSSEEVRVTPSQPSPAHPIPTSIEVVKDTVAKTATAGSRISEPFMVTSEMRGWASEKVPGLNVNTVTESFVDYWRGIPGVKGRKSDWTSTWRNWLRRESERIGTTEKPRVTAAQRNLTTVEHFQELEAQKEIAS